jgi:hypothetical protein
MLNESKGNTEENPTDYVNPKQNHGAPF